MLIRRENLSKYVLRIRSAFDFNVTTVIRKHDCKYTKLLWNRTIRKKKMAKNIEIYYYLTLRYGQVTIQRFRHSALMSSNGIPISCNSVWGYGNSISVDSRGAFFATIWLLTNYSENICLNIWLFQIFFVPLYLWTRRLRTYRKHCWPWRRRCGWCARR